MYGNLIVIVWNKKVVSREANFFTIKEDMIKIFNEINILQKEEL